VTPAAWPARQRPSRPKRARHPARQGKKTREAPVQEVGRGNHTSYPGPHPFRRKPEQQTRSQERSHSATKNRTSPQPFRLKAAGIGSRRCRSSTSLRKFRLWRSFQIVPEARDAPARLTVEAGPAQRCAPKDAFAFALELETRLPLGSGVHLRFACA
jgi:hypothetical protein